MAKDSRQGARTEVSQGPSALGSGTLSVGQGNVHGNPKSGSSTDAAGASSTFSRKTLGPDDSHRRPGFKN